MCYVTGRATRCLAVYRGHLAAILMVLGARLTVRSLQGYEERLVETLFSGDALKPLTLAQGELVEALLLSPSGRRARMVLTTHRQAVDFPLVGVATAREGETGPVHLALTGVGPRPLRPRELETALAKADPSERGELVRKQLRGIRFTPNVIWGGPHLRQLLPHLVVEALAQADAAPERRSNLA